jgi:hypothetical protein
MSGRFLRMSTANKRDVSPLRHPIGLIRIRSASPESARLSAGAPARARSGHHSNVEGAESGLKKANKNGATRLQRAPWLRVKVVIALLERIRRRFELGFRPRTMATRRRNTTHASLIQIGRGCMRRSSRCCGGKLSSLLIASVVCDRASSITSRNSFGRPPGLPDWPFGKGLPTILGVRSSLTPRCSERHQEQAKQAISPSAAKPRYLAAASSRPLPNALRCGFFTRCDKAGLARGARA